MDKEPGGLQSIRLHCHFSKDFRFVSNPMRISLEPRNPRAHLGVTGTSEIPRGAPKRHPAKAGSSD